MDQRSQQLAVRTDVKLTDVLLLASPDYASKVITAITKGATTMVTSTAHGFATGDEIYITGVAGMTEINGMTGVVGETSTDQFELLIDSSAFTNYTSGGVAVRGRLQRCTINDLAEFFATTAQLVANQTADRDRANHTGTQPASTISDFDAAADARIANWVGAAPEALDTLEELAAALGDDANFSSTVTAALAGKMAKSANLSDVDNVAAARTNLGLGSMATQATSSYFAVANAFSEIGADGDPRQIAARANLGLGDMAQHSVSSYNAAWLIPHTGASTNVHGIGSGNAVVGTGTTQTLTNKTHTAPLLTAGSSFDVTGAGSVALFASMGANTLSIGGPTTTVSILGNLEVQGTKFVANVTDMEVEDKNIIINNGGNDGTSEGAGLTVKRTTTNGSLIYGAAYASKWAAGNVGSEVELANISSAQTFTNKNLDAAANTITNLDRYGTLANVPTTNVKDGMIYRPSDGLLPLRAQGNSWKPLYNGRVITDPLTVLGPPDFQWVATGTNNEYRLEALGGGSPGISQPATVFINNVEAPSGTIGSLAQGSYAWGSSGGFNTLVVRLAGNANPQTRAWGYVRGDALAWMVKGNMSATVSHGHLFLTSTSNAGTLTCRFRGRLAPSTPYTAYCLLWPGSADASVLIHQGIGWSDGTAFSSIGYRYYNRTVYVTNMSDATTFSSDTTNVETSGLPEFLAIRDDGTNRSFYIGTIPDYTRMTRIASMPRTTFLTPTHVGLVDLRNAWTGGSFFPHFEVVPG